MHSSFPSYRILLVVDNRIYRKLLRELLEAEGEFVVVGEAGDGDEAARAAAELSPDVVLMDLETPRRNGVDACREIVESSPRTRVVMLTASDEVNAMNEAADAGAAAYLQKVGGLERLVGALRKVAVGDSGESVD